MMISQWMLRLTTEEFLSACNCDELQSDFDRDNEDELLEAIDYLASKRHTRHRKESTHGKKKSLAAKKARLERVQLSRKAGAAIAASNRRKNRAESHNENSGSYGTANGNRKPEKTG